uniref:t-SNARE coiled-coil homology domain-containing protein n=1 Tax=Arcella intermedia TaxID=1963864 RepID=A0A6B2LDN4_9EUKA
MMKKLMEIDAACSPVRKVKEQEEAEKNLDEFTKEKRRMAEFIREIRQDIKEREALYKDDHAKGVKKGAEIRRKIKEATEKAEELEKMYKTKHKKLKTKEKIGSVPEEKKAKDENRKQIVDVMWQHLRELEKQEKNVTGTSNAFTGQDSISEDGEKDISGMALPDLDDPRLALIKKNDQEIDEMLDQTKIGVGRLKQLALEIGEKVEESNILIDEVQQMAEITLGNLESVNSQLKKTLDSAQSRANCCCDIILCCMLLGIITAIYFVLTK